MTGLRFLGAPSVAGGMLVLGGLAGLTGGGGGCTARGDMAIPPTARVLASGNGGRLEATPPRDGTVYVYDASDNRIVYSGLVRADDEVVVDPGANLVTINGKTVTEPRLHRDHQYKIEFDRP